LQFFLLGAGIGEGKHRGRRGRRVWFRCLLQIVRFW